MNMREKNEKRLSGRTFKAAAALVVLAFCAMIPLSAQNNALEWYGLQSMALGPQYSGGESPYGNVTNPASAAWVQRVTLDLSYLITAGLAEEQGTAHIVNLGAAIPTNLGVFGISGQFGTSNLSSLALGTYGSLNASFSKDLLDDLSVGFGLGFQYGASASGVQDWGLGLDLGFVNKPGDLGFLKDFAWGAAIKGLGKAMYLDSTVGPWPTTFTPGVGAQFKIVREKDVDLGFNFDLDFPMVYDTAFKPDLQFNAGIALGLFKLVDLQIGYDFDVAKLASNTDRSVPLNFSVKFDLGGATVDKDENGKPLPFYKTSEFKPAIVVAPYRNGLWTFGAGVNVPIGVVDAKAPVITAEAPEEVWISPNFDGVQDDLTVPLKIEDERYITSYTLYVYNEAGELVRIIRSKEERPENRDIDTLAKRFIRVKSGIQIPESVTWDGQGGTAEETPAPTGDVPAASPAPSGSPAPTLLLETGKGDTSSGTTAPGETPAPASAAPTVAPAFKNQPLPDGTYYWVIESTDDNGNVSRTVKKIVHVDSTPPALKVEAPMDKGFAPGGDRPAFIFSQSSSPEERWTGKILDAEGKLVRSFVWTKETGGLPAQGVWDGKDDANVLVKDGVYSYILSCTDKAGNVSVATIDNIVLLNRPTPVNLLVDNAWFSPNKDGIKDTVFLSVDASREVAVETWKAELFDANGIAVRTQEGKADLPKSITVDGRNDQGRVLPEGKYTLKLDVLYVNGNKPQAQSPELILDLTPPSANLKADYRLFSPDGDGNKDFVRVLQQSSDEPQWMGTIKNAQGLEVQRYVWRGKPDLALDWDGKSSDGKQLPDGSYTYQVFANDLAGNYGVSNSLELRVDTTPTVVTLNATRPAFSPNADSVLDTQVFALGLDQGEGVESWEVKVIPANGDSGAAVKTWTGSGRPAPTLEWDGKDTLGKIVADGSYQAVAQVTYLKGNKPRVLSRNFDVDTKAPSAALKTDISPVKDSGKIFFSPDGDKNLDVLTFMQDSSQEETWTAAILDKNGNELRSFSYTGKLPSQMVWDGTDSTGNILRDDSYSYRVSSTDMAGNKFSSEIKGITLDTKPTALSLKIAGIAFSPNGDGIKDRLDLLPVLEQNSDIRQWTLLVQPASGGSARTITGTAKVEDKLSWDGKTDGGRMAPEGDYVAKLSVEYLKGNKVEATSPKFSLDLTAPQARAYANASLFSPDGDGQNDQVKISVEASKETLWKGNVFYAGSLGSRLVKVPAEAPPVASWEWKATPPANLAWDGASAQGVAVVDGDYLFVLSATDEAGNTGTSSPITLQVDKRPINLGLVPSDKAFSPNGDGRKDVIKLAVNASTIDGIDSWKLDIKDEKGLTQRSISGKNDLPKSFEWDGKSDQGKAAAEGDYKAELTVSYLKGNKPKAVTEAFDLDLTPPALTLNAEDLIFSPDGDGRKDLVRFAQKSSAEDLWEGKITDAKGKVVKALFWKGEAKDFAWDGRDENGNRQDDGTFAYSISSTDSAGNTRSEKVGGITIDTRAASVLVSVNARGFTPGSANTQVASIGFRPFLGLKDGVDSWTLDLQINNESMYRLNGKGLPPDVINWDGYMGTGASRKMAPEGRYEAVLAVEYTKGTRPEARSTPFVLDISAPNVKLSITPQPFSPDDDGVDDEVAIGLNVDDPSGIKDWELKILEPEDSGKPGKVFASFSGTGQPTSRIVWYGKSSTGELVQAAEDYRVVLTITDNLGNKGVSSDQVISVDVLVIREADGVLRIKIPGISFPSNSANLKGVDGDKLAKNNRTLDRIAQILRKYSTYSIQVEGHANITKFWDKALADKEQKDELLPLSQKRAEAVMQALIERGIPASRLEALGVGGSRPVVNNNDVENVWKNRRVEFLLRK